MFLIRPKPLLSESLSSWRQRAGVANGFRRYPRPDGLYSWAEPDCFPALKEAQWLQDEYRLQPEDVRAMCLEAVGNNISFDFGRTKKLRWVIPCANRKVWNLGGSCCPLCLEEDEIPYFRLSWRFAFITHCPKHGCPLIEQCSTCSTLLWPTNVRNISTNRQFDFRNCHSCGSALEACGDMHEPLMSTSRVLWDCATTQLVPAHLKQAKNSCEVFSALWAISQLLLRKNASGIWKFFPDDFSKFDRGKFNFGEGINTIELLPNEARRSVIDAAYWMISEWPNHFVLISQKAHLSRYLFSPIWLSQPQWMTNVIEENLSIRTIGITSLQVHAAIDSIKDAGKPVSKMAVRRVLGVSESLAINEILSQRRTGSLGELKRLCGMFEHRLMTVSDSRDQKASLIRDYLIFLVSALLNQKIEKVCLLTKDSVATLLSTESLHGVSCTPLYKLISHRANQLNDIYLEQYRLLNPDFLICDGRMFLARNGDVLAGHTVRDRITKMMKSGFPPDLWKSADVFLGVIGK